MLRKPDIDHREHFARSRIRRELPRRGQKTGAVFAEGVPIVVVEVPLAARRLSSIHEHAGLHAHLAIEELHAKLLPAFRVRSELVRSA